jgi:hypothetical protein
MVDDFTRDRRASRRVGSPTTDYERDQRASERVGGSGDPTDEPADDDDRDLGGTASGGGSDSSPRPTPSPGGTRGGSPDATADDSLIADVQERVGDATRGVRDGVTDLPEDVRDAGSAAADRVDDARTSVGERVGEAGDAVRERVADAPEAVRERVGTAARDAAADVDTDVTDELTTGGVLSERPGSDEGLVPGEIGGREVREDDPVADRAGIDEQPTVDVSEQRLREARDDLDARAEQEFADNPELTVAGSDVPDRVVTGAAESAVDVANPFGLAMTAETATEVATSTPGVVADEGAADVGATTAGVGAAAGIATAESARENPVEFAGGSVFNFVGGAGASRQFGAAVRAGRDRVRTAGGERIDADELAGQEVLRNVETDGAEGEQFPGADEPGLYQSDPADAVREQAERNTPEQVDDVFGGPAQGNEATLTKALDTEPEGPGAGRADTGFSSAPGETAADFDYETPGSFFGPELSPNFLRVGSRESFSARPGLPDFGNRPTAVMARTDVETPEADDLQGFNQEMLDRAGETTARTKPASEVNPGEIEAVVPPGAEFQSVGGGGLLGRVGSRLGIGSEFYTEIGGRRVPIRTVAPEGRDTDAGDVDADDLAPAAPRGTLDELSEPVSAPTDRPVPVGASPAGTAAPSEPAGTTDVFGSPAAGGGSSPVSSPRPPGSTGGGAGSTPSGAPGDGGGGSGRPSPPRDPVVTSPFGGAASSGSGASSPDRPAPVTTPSGRVTPSGGDSDTAPVSDPFGGEALVGLGAPTTRQQRRRRDDGRDDTDPDREPINAVERAPLTTPFTNPIASSTSALFGDAGGTDGVF